MILSYIFLHKQQARIEFGIKQIDLSNQMWTGFMNMLEQFESPTQPGYYSFTNFQLRDIYLAGIRNAPTLTLEQPVSIDAFILITFYNDDNGIAGN